MRAVEEWFRSYKFEELWDAEGPDKGGDFIEEIKSLIPPPKLAMGNNKHTFGLKHVKKELIVPDYSEFIENADTPGIIGSSSMIRIGHYLKKVFEVNSNNKNFRFFSPDETYSNKLNKIFETTSRAFAGPIAPWDKDLSPDGRVMEMLSEHSLQAMMQGYVLTGRYGVFASYEAFIQVVSSMADQYAKFLRIAKDIPWRGSIPSFNYILTSSGWRQEHNGFSHQNPGFIDSMLQKHGSFVRVFFPPDGNSALAVMKTCLESEDKINIIVAGKTIEPRWLTPENAEEELKNGLAIWKFASELDPDIVFSAAGEYLTKEALAAIKILKKTIPEVKTRFVSIMEMSAIGIGNTKQVSLHNFESYYTKDKPVIFNFHGYPETLKQTLFDYQNGKNRFFVHGYIENGSTTTQFDLHLRNKTSRYDLLMEAFTLLAKNKVIKAERCHELIEEYNQKISDHRDYIIQHGVDPEEIENWKW